VNNTTQFRPKTVYVSAGVIYFVIVGEVAVSFTHNSAKAVLVAAAWALFIGNCAHLLFIRPKVTFGDEGIIITNPLQSIQVGWQRVESIEAKYTMSITVGGKSIYAWGAPAPSRYHSRSVHPSEVRGLGIGNADLIRPGESPRSDSGTAAYYARTYLHNFRTQNLIGCESHVRINYRGGFIAIISLAMALGFYSLGF
jgi:hypothetical protein